LLLTLPVADRPTILVIVPTSLLFFFFIPPAPPDIYTLSLHDALPISLLGEHIPHGRHGPASSEWEWSLDTTARRAGAPSAGRGPDRKSTRLNSSHEWISYAVFCLKKKKQSVEGVHVP